MRISTRLATGALALGCLFCGWSATPRAVADDASTPPVVDSVYSSSRYDDMPPEGVVSLHAVRRTPTATIVYLSIGFATEPGKERFLSGYLGGRLFSTGTVTEQVSSDAAILDRKNKVLYTPLVEDGHGCIVCTDEEIGIWTAYSPKETAFIAYVGLPPLPADTTTVSVMAGGRLFNDVPVTDGLLEPQVAYPDTSDTIKLGQGWPTVALDKVSKASDPKKFSIHPLTQTVEQSRVRERDQTDKVQFDLSTKVLFDKDKAVVKPDGKKAIEALAGKLKDRSGTIQVTGYTDNLGSEEHGLELSKQRADAVAAILKPLLPSRIQLKTAGLGEANPIASNETEAGREQNRRVTVTVKG